MEPQAVNTVLGFVVGAGVGSVIITYFSPLALRHLSAWAEARASAIEYQKKMQAKILQRLNPQPSEKSMVKIERSNVIITQR